MKGKIGNFVSIPPEEWGDKELVEVDATGCGCLMFDMEVFKNIPYPWFKFYKDADTGSDVGEDIGFCRELKNAGYKIFVDVTVPSDHLTTMAVNMKTHKLYRSMKTIEYQKNMAMALVGNNPSQDDENK
jgi:hypothetical protein